MTTPDLAALLPLALDMTASLSGDDRARRMLEVVRRALPCDAVALLRLDGDALVPAAAWGLSADVLGRRFRRGEHPRLDVLRARTAPIRFPADSPLPDPYDGLVLGGEPKLGGQVHSCLGCPLFVEGELVGVLTADALRPGAFDGLDDAFLSTLAALAGASLRTSDLIDRLQQQAEHQGQVASDLARDALSREGSVLIGPSTALARLRREIQLVAHSGFPALVTGETGVGKELCVRLLHAQSPRADLPLVYVNCAALPEAIVESELFGHVRGAFTGAERERLGKFRTAHGASLFLDEIGELPLSMQPKLLRVLQEGEVQCVGSDEPLRVDVRVFVATNRDLAAEVRAGRFRADLLHRLDVCRIEVPALRERPEDVAPLAGHFADRARGRLGTGPIRFTPEARDALTAAEWPGNVRELENVVARAVLRAAARTERGTLVLVEARDLDPRVGGSGPSARPLDPATPSAPPPKLRAAVDDYQRRLVREALARHAGSWAAAARELGVERANLQRLARRLGLR